MGGATSNRLSEFFVRKIAETEGVAPERVTPEYIKNRRAALRGDIRLNTSSNYGGYSTEGLRVLSNEERDSLLKWLEEDDHRITSELALDVAKP